MDLGFAAIEEGDWGDDDDAVDEPPSSIVPVEVEVPVGVQGKAVSNGVTAVVDLTEEETRARPHTKPSAGPPTSKIHRNPRTRYFVIKSSTHKNLVLSIENNVWATQRHNEEKFNEAFHNAPHVILIFSVNSSGCFQGYAKMLGRVGTSKKTDVFKGFGRAFDVRWLRLDDLNFSEVGEILNPLNENKSVKISRDGQELSNEAGRRLCELVDLRVYRSDPAGYAADDGEVETGGFGPPTLSLPSSEPPAAKAPTPLPSPELAPPGPPPEVFGQRGFLPPGPSPYGVGLPPPIVPPGYPPPAHPPQAWPPWGFPPHAWGYSWRSRQGGSSYSSYSYSDYSYSEDEDRGPRSVPQVPLAAFGGSKRRRREEVSAVLPTPTSGQELRPERDRRRRRQEDPPKKEKKEKVKEKDKKEHRSEKKEKRHKDREPKAAVAAPIQNGTSKDKHKKDKKAKDSDRHRHERREGRESRRRRRHESDVVPAASRGPPSTWEGASAGTPHAWHARPLEKGAPPGHWHGACPTR